jgi:hypothetical protein
MAILLSYKLVEIIPSPKIRALSGTLEKFTVLSFAGCALEKKAGNKQMNKKSAAVGLHDIDRGFGMLMINNNCE